MEIDLNIKRIILGFLTLYVSKCIFIDIIMYIYGLTEFLLLICFLIGILAVLTGLYPKNLKFIIK